MNHRIILGAGVYFAIWTVLVFVAMAQGISIMLAVLLTLVICLACWLGFDDGKRAPR